MIPDGLPDTRGLSPVAILLAQSFDDLPNDRRVRVRVYNALTNIILSELYPRAPESIESSDPQLPLETEPAKPRNRATPGSN